MKKILTGTTAAFCLIAVAVVAHAQSQRHSGNMMQMMHGPMVAQNMSPGMDHQMGNTHSGMADHGKAKGDTSASSLAFEAANKKMHEAMDITFTGKADVDFVKGMIPHHQGAIDMAKVVLAYGKDPQVKKLAEDIIKAQESEIAMMQDWLKKNGG